jgi:glutamate 5-kinase
LEQLKGNCKRVVIKIGSSLFCGARNELDFTVFEKLVSQVTFLAQSGREVAVVSSGAIALGMHSLRLKERPKELANLQAAAAIGQNELMNTYARFLKARGFLAAQILLTSEDFSDRKRYLNARNTLIALLGYRKCGTEAVIPIINENDTVSTDEIRFGDNDRLSAQVAALVSADLLVILSDVDGLLEKDKKTLVPLVEKITPGIRALASPTNSKTCVGGMITKIDAAKIASDSGIPCVIANGRKHDSIILAVQNLPGAGTLFLPIQKGLAAKKRWIAFSTRTKGRVVVDEGAKAALANNKRSLLAVGITAVQGVFEPGDIVQVTDRQGNDFARGKVSVSSKQLEKVIGTRFGKEVIHRDNIVVF